MNHGDTALIKYARRFETKLAYTRMFQVTQQFFVTIIEYCPSNMKWLFFVANSSKSLRTVRGSAGREYHLVRQICIDSSKGTFVNKEHTSKEHIVSLLCLCDLVQSTKAKESLIVNWLVEIGLLCKVN